MVFFSFLKRDAKFKNVKNYFPIWLKNFAVKRMRLTKRKANLLKINWSVFDMSKRKQEKAIE